MTNRRLWGVTATCLLLCLPASAASKPDVSPVVVVQADGHRLRVDQIGAASGGGGLAVRTETKSVRITRVIPWNRIDSVIIGGESFAAAVVRDYCALRETEVLALPAEGRAPEGAAVVAVGNQPPDRVDPFGPSRLSRPRQKERTGKERTGEKAPSLRREGARAYRVQRRPHSVVAPGCLPATAEPYPPAVLPPTPARVIGVRKDPLSAYDALVAEAYPHGVPLAEVPFALDVMRARKAADLLGPPPAPERPPRGPAEVSESTSNHRLSAIAVSARPVSAHGRADFDSLAVEITGFDRLGQPVPVRGTVQATLRGQSQRLVRAFGTRLVGRAGPVETLHRWTRHVDAARERIVLPLPRPLPDHDARRGPLGQVSVRLLVPGQGVFEAASGPVVLKHLGPLRDRNLAETGSRFLAEELTHGSRRPSGVQLFNPSAIRPNGRVLSVQP